MVSLAASTYVPVSRATHVREAHLCRAYCRQVME